MTIFMNIDQVPAGQHLYTAFLAHRDPHTDDWEPGDEIDFTAGATLTSAQVLTAAQTCEDYKDYDGANTRVAGIVDNSSDEIVYDARAELGIEVNE